MTAQEIKNKLTENDILKLMSLLNAVPSIVTDDYYTFPTKCHDGNSNKLYFYRDSKLFHCYTHCGQMSVLDVISNAKDYSLSQSIHWICIQLGWNTRKIGFGNEEIEEVINDWSFINHLKNKREKIQNKQYDNFHDTSILNIFQNIYCTEWIEDGISIETMQKYDIKYSTLQQKIIIPHYDINKNLMGIRGRVLLEEEEKVYGKYAPFQLHGKMYNHPLSQNLYGIHKNKETIIKKKKVMLVESEKGVLQVDTMMGDDNNFTLALCGNILSKYQKNLILSLGVEEVIIALDRQYKNLADNECLKWSIHIRKKIIEQLAPYVRVYVVWDRDNLLGYKMSPTDCGKETLLQLMKRKIYVGTYE